MKKMLVVLLSILLITNSAFANVTYYVEEKFAGTMGEKEESGTVTYIVELEGGGLLERKHSRSGASDFADFEAQAINEINEVQEEAVFHAEAITGEEVKNTYTHIMNGFSIDGDASLADTLNNISGVKSVSIADTFYFEASSQSTLTNTPNHFAQDELIGLSEEIRESYTGKGIVIGVIDSEFRHEHEAFQTIPEVQTLTKEEIIQFLKNNELAAEVNLRNSMGDESVTEEELADRFYNNGKNPFMFDYVGCDTDASITQNYLHGTHVAAIAAGNSDVFKGVAPDAQLVLMKVSSDGTSGASEANICAALDDLVKLKVDVISVSMGNKAGFMHNERYNNIFASIEEEGIVVSMSVGNSFRFGENRMTLNPMAEHPDYGMISTPAAYEYPTAVASKNALTLTGDTEEKMSDFSSWGATTDLRLKPEITALGGYMISAGRNNTYEYMSGTSMATPQYAGATALMLQYFNENVDYSKSLKERNAQKLLATSAQIEYDDSLPVSPRKQGAGVINITNALTAPTLMYHNSKTKIELGEIGDSIEFSFDIENLSPTKTTYMLDSVIMTDAYQTSDGVNLVTKSRLLENSSATFKHDSLNITSIELNPFAKKTVTVTLTLSDEEIEELASVFKNGFYVEGYIKATDTSTNKESSIPFMGFHRGISGGWKEAPLFHGNIMNVKPGYLGFTGIYSNSSSGMNFLNYHGDSETLFYSTNGDSELIMFSDNIRNLRKLNVKVTDSESNVVFNKNANYMTKNDSMYAVNSQNQLVYDFSPYHGMVLSNSTSKIPDGSYTVTYTGVSEYDGETTQGGSFNLYVDSVYPLITEAEYKISGVRAYLYVKGTDNVLNPRIFVVDSTGKIKDSDSRENGYYIFDMTGYDVTSCLVAAQDAAGNTAAYKVTSANGFAAAYKGSALSRIDMFDAFVLGRKIINKIEFTPQDGENVRYFAWDSKLKPLTD